MSVCVLSVSRHPCRLAHVRVHGRKYQSPESQLLFSTPPQPSLLHIISYYFIFLFLFYPPIDISDFATSQPPPSSGRHGNRASELCAGLKPEGKLNMWELADRPSHSESGVNLDLSGTLIWLIGHPYVPCSASASCLWELPVPRISRKSVLWTNVRDHH